MKIRILLISYLIFASQISSYAQVFKSQESALEEAFTNADTVLRKTLFLTDEQIIRIQKKAKAPIESKLVTYYKGRNDTSTLYAFFETHIVRTKPETFMIIVDENGKIRYVDLLAFYEPMDYLPTPKWFQLFNGKSLDNKLWPKRDIDTITGATLSVQAMTQGVRKILAIYEVGIVKGE